MTNVNFYGARAYVLMRLKMDLPSTYTYHSLWHTRDDVTPAAIALADALGINGEDKLLIRTAALYHDIGYLESRQEHEAVGVRMCKDVLPRFGYSASQIERIGGMIMATRLPQSPSNIYEQILADADLDSLGRTDFLTTSLALRSELETVGVVKNDLDWFTGQRTFLATHEYFTGAARVRRSDGKAKNIALLDTLIAEAQPAK